MGDDLTDDFKLQTLWREHELKMQAAKDGGKTTFFGRDIKDLIIWGLLVATAGTNDKIQTLLESVLK